ncbi:MAG: helix-turn-helix transcriptional regulator [Bacillota bacterium]|nr:helix-turn-helix transcriptional regulator [Bacillota bacterium]
MDQLTNKIRTELIKQYKSVRQFSLSTGIPQTTVSGALKNGVSGTAYRTVIKICRVLNITPENSVNILTPEEDISTALQMFLFLDESGKEMVFRTIKTQHKRCSKKD